MSKVKTKGSRPWWWKPLWIGVILSTIVLGFANFFFWHVPIERAVSAMALTLVCVGIAYYIRVRPSMKVNRALYILLGITPIGFILWVIWGGQRNRPVDNRYGWSFSFSSHKLGSMLWHRSIHRRLDRQKKKLSPSIKPLKILKILLSCHKHFLRSRVKQLANPAQPSNSHFSRDGAPPSKVSAPTNKRRVSLKSRILKSARVRAST
jgi:hypothetical protein